jgi:Uncharacterized conserved protein
MKIAFFLILLVSSVPGILFAQATHKSGKMVLIHAQKQSFVMGMDTSELFANEPHQGWASYVGKHKVSFTYDFYMDTTLVTQGEYLKLMGYNPSGKNTGDMTLPVEKVSWFDAILYCNARSHQDKLDSVYTYTAIERNGNSVVNITGLTYDIMKNGYRLPTNAEYEYTERANTTGKYFFSPDEKNVEESGKEYSWSIRNTGFTYQAGGIKTQPVATKKANPWGIYDLIGNLFEWCSDWDAPYVLTDETNPVGMSSSPEGKKVAKGGSFRTDIMYHMRIAYHYKWTPSDTGGEIGFRCVRTKQ